MIEFESEPLDIPEFETPFLFRTRPLAIAADLRPNWRIGIIILLLRKCCKNGRTSLARLHVLSWGVRTVTAQRQLSAVVERRQTPSSMIVRFEPSLNRAVDFAIGEKLIRRADGAHIELTDAGRALATELIDREEAFKTEKLFMDDIRFQVTETLVNTMFSSKGQ